jgi:hypothetical protein
VLSGTGFVGIIEYPAKHPDVQFFFNMMVKVKLDTSSHTTKTSCHFPFCKNYFYLAQCFIGLKGT